MTGSPLGLDVVDRSSSLPVGGRGVPRPGRSAPKPVFANIQSWCPYVSLSWVGLFPVAFAMM
jgi:hypothetical protein